MISDEINSVAISFFSCFLFHQEVCSSKNYRAFGFKLPDKKLISLRRITIFQDRMPITHQNLRLQFFSNMKCDCAAENSRSMQILYIFRCHHPTRTRCAAAFPFPACTREVHEIFFCADSNYGNGCTYICMYKIQISGVIMIGSITLKCRFGEKLWANGASLATPAEGGAQLLLCFAGLFQLG